MDARSTRRWHSGPDSIDGGGATVFASAMTNEMPEALEQIPPLEKRLAKWSPEDAS